MCDGDDDCHDNSDELNCPPRLRNCSESEHTCDDGQCVRDASGGRVRCDGFKQCDDGSDEQHCDATCGAGQVACDGGHCIARSWRCDGDVDCPRADDERNCNISGTQHVMTSCATL